MKFQMTFAWNSKVAILPSHKSSWSKCKAIEFPDRRSVISQSGVSLLGFIIGSKLCSNEAIAATPTFDDYEGTMNGAKLKQEVESKVPEAVVRDLGLTQAKLGNKEDIVAFASKTAQSIAAIQILVDNADWAGVRSVLRGESSKFEGNVLSICRKPFFGIKGGEKGYRKAIALSEDDLSSLENAREEFSFSLAELEDFALENRSIFFNSLDRQQVDELISESGFQENKEEGQSLLNAAMQSSSTFLQFISTL